MTLLTGLVAYWSMDGTSVDGLGSTNGVDTNVTYPTGKRNQGIKFTGTASYCIAANNIPTLDALSVSLWVKPTAGSADEKYFMRDESGGTNWGLMLSQTVATLAFQVGVQTTVNWRTVDAIGTLTAGTWYHLVLTYDLAVMRLYINGIQNNTATYNEGTKFTGNKDFRIGTLNTTTNLSTALIDEIGVWNRALTTAEIAQLFVDLNVIPYQLSLTHGTGVQDYLLQEDGSKLLQEDNNDLLLDFPPFTINNFITGVQAGDGMSVTEKVR